MKGILICTFRIVFVSIEIEEIARPLLYHCCEKRLLVPSLKSGMSLPSPNQRRAGVKAFSSM